MEQANFEDRPNDHLVDEEDVARYVQGELNPDQQIRVLRAVHENTQLARFLFFYRNSTIRDSQEASAEKQN